MSIGSFIYDYQTLIAGALALAAAYFAAKPVWRQLELTQTQSNGVLREMLLHRQVEVQQARAALMANVGSKLFDLDHALGCQGDGEFISEHDAFGNDQILSQSISWLRTGYHWRDRSRVEAARAELIDKIDTLLQILEAIHAPAHTDQHDEDRSISDEDWAAFLARGVAAKGEVAGAVGAARTTFNNLLLEMESEAEALKERLTKVNEALLG
jgi:hypothetical protein